MYLIAEHSHRNAHRFNRCQKALIVTVVTLALGLYIDERATVGQAARVAGLSTPAFLDELGRRKIPVHYGLEDLEADMATVRTLEDMGKV